MEVVSQVDDAAGGVLKGISNSLMDYGALGLLCLILLVMLAFATYKANDLVNKTWEWALGENGYYTALVKSAIAFQASLTSRLEELHQSQQALKQQIANLPCNRDRHHVDIGDR